MTLRHIVSWRLSGETLAERDAQAQRVRDAMEPLRESVPSVRALNLYRNELHEGINFDLTLIVDFDDAEGLAAYAAHPDHLVIVELMKELTVSRASTDFTL